MMQLADAIHGVLRPSQRIRWTYTDPSTGAQLPQDLTGATLTGRLYQRMISEPRPIQGNLTVFDALNGDFDWNYSLPDVVMGTYLVQFNAAYGAAPTPGKTFVALWRVRMALP